jgi:Ca-activated chloride channel family protein
MCKIHRTWRSRLAPLPAAAFFIAWVLLVIALARPQASQVQIKDITRGIAMEMVPDRSGSMRENMNYGGRRMNRLETVKEIFSQFVFGDGKELKGRGNDLIGVIGFAHYPYTFCPLTLDHDALKFSLGNIELITSEGDENGTAIGDAVAMAVARLQAAEKTLAAQTSQDGAGYRITSKVIILLTDGQDEGPHTRSIPQAAELAEKYGIKVYSIAIVGGGRVINTPMGQMQLSGGNYDTSQIQQLAKQTGGRFMTCDSAEDLLEIYKEIDRLEKSEMLSLRHVTYRELYFPFAAAALAAIVAGIMMNCTIFRRIP